MRRTSLKKLIRGNKINWICLINECPNNCCEKIDGNINSMLPLFNTTHHLIPLTDKDALTIKKHTGSTNIVQLNDGIKYIRCNEKGRCPFLDKDGKCSIYKWRGSSCKSYPFFVDKYSGLYIDLNCPGVGKGWTDLKNVIHMIEELQKIYSLHFNVTINKLKKLRL